MSDLKQATSDAALEIFERFARLALKADMGARECANLCERAFVRAAARREGTRSTVSDIANRTGLSRNKVRAFQSAEPQVRHEDIRRQPRTSRVIWGWRNNPKFSSAPGIPRILPLFGARSFAELVKLYSTEERPRPVLRELDYRKLIRRHEGKRIELLDDDARPGLDLDGIRELGTAAGDLIDMLSYELEHPEGGAGRYFRYIVNPRMKPDAALVQGRDHARQIRSMANAMAGFIVDPEVTVKPGRNSQSAVRMGVLLCVSQQPVMVSAAGSAQGSTPLRSNELTKTRAPPERRSRRERTNQQDEKDLQANVISKEIKARTLERHAASHRQELLSGHRPSVAKEPRHHPGE
jgi:Family of unknown function (DUF6502)